MKKSNGIPFHMYLYKDTIKAVEIGVKLNIFVAAPYISFGSHNFAMNH